MRTSTDSVALRAFLDSPARPAGTLHYHELQGFFAIASAPKRIPPSEWMPIIFGGEDAGVASLDETKLVVSEIMALYNTVNAAVADEVTGLPDDCPFHADIFANFGEQAPIGQWCRGFVYGHQCVDELWEAYLPADVEGEFAGTLMALGFFASREMAEDLWTEIAEPDLSFAAMAETIREVFPDALAEYAHQGRSIHMALAEHEQGDHEPRRAVRIGRNDPCPCGSGQTYKRCCGATVH